MEIFRHFIKSFLLIFQSIKMIPTRFSKIFSLFIVFSIFSITAFSQIPALGSGCFTQVNIPASWNVTEQAVFTPEQKVMIAPPAYEMDSISVLTREPAVEQYFVCETGEDGLQRNKVCSKDIPAEYETITFQREVTPAVYRTIPAQVVKVKKLVKTRDGYIATVPCEKVETTRF